LILGFKVETSTKYLKNSGFRIQSESEPGFGTNLMVAAASKQQHDFQRRKLTIANKYSFKVRRQSKSRFWVFAALELEKSQLKSPEQFSRPAEKVVANKSFCGIIKLESEYQKVCQRKLALSWEAEASFSGLFVFIAPRRW